MQRQEPIREGVTKELKGYDGIVSITENKNLYGNKTPLVNLFWSLLAEKQAELNIY